MQACWGMVLLKHESKSKAGVKSMRLFMVKDAFQLILSIPEYIRQLSIGYDGDIAGLWRVVQTSPPLSPEDSDDIAGFIFPEDDHSKTKGILGFHDMVLRMGHKTIFVRINLSVFRLIYKYLEVCFCVLTCQFVINWGETQRQNDAQEEGQASGRVFDSIWVV